MKTITNNTLVHDGFGENVKIVLYTMMYAEFHGMQFVYTPFKHLEHNDENDPDFLAKKEKVLGFIHYFPLSNGTELILNHLKAISFFTKNTKWCENCASLRHARDIVHESIQKNISQTRRCAIHIRRMNHDDKKRVTSETDVLPGMDVPLFVYQEVMNKLLQIDPTITFHIYSQGDISSFTELGDCVIFHLNESIEDTFIGMVTADILVMAPSAFSYVSGMFSRSPTILYIRHYSSPLPSWMEIQGYQSTRMAYELCFTSMMYFIFDPIREICYKNVDNEYIHQNTPTLRVSHRYGFFSCFSVLLTGIVDYVQKTGAFPDQINTDDLLEWYKPTQQTSTILSEYITMNRCVIHFTTFNEDVQYTQYNTIPPEIDAYLPFFSPTVDILNRIAFLKEKYKIDPEHTIVAFYRGNDKATETRLCTYSEMIDQVTSISTQIPLYKNTSESNNTTTASAESNNTQKAAARARKPVWIQTDETEFIQFASAVFPDSFYCIDEIRHIPRQLTSVDKVACALSNHEASKWYLAITILMSQCKYVVCNSSGNCPLWIYLYRKRNILPDGHLFFQYWNGSFIMT